MPWYSFWQDCQSAYVTLGTFLIMIFCYLASIGVEIESPQGHGLQMLKEMEAQVIIQLSHS